MQKQFLTITSVLILTSCASVEDLTGSKPIIDTAGVNFAQYESDLEDCSAYADQVAIANKVATGAVSGAVVGSLIGAALGNSSIAKRGAGVGAVGGAGRNVSAGLQERQRVIKRCLIGRGYRVLN